MSCWEFFSGGLALLGWGTFNGLLNKENVNDRKGNYSNK
jgi:hypothetical protein